MSSLFIRHLLLVLLLYAVSPLTWAYPGFIGYGYSTCATCHYNPQGSGPLTDYGRALFAQEIAARFWIPKSVSDESLAERSGFLPGAGEQSRLRPAFKYRGLWYQLSPKTSGVNSKWVNMQQDANMVVHLDRDAQHVLSLTAGLLSERRVFYKNGNDKSNIFMREYFLRSYFGSVSFTMGLIDKVYGIRSEDHTTYSRGRLGLGQNDQVHGLAVQWSLGKIELTGHVFLGNLHRVKEDRQNGFSGMLEIDIAPRNRIGVSYLEYQTTFVKARRGALHDRVGIKGFHGSSVMAEIGLRQDQNISGGLAPVGGYAMVQGLFNLTRGFNILTTVEGAQDKLSMQGTRSGRWSIGLLTFPWQRVEARLGCVQTKTYSSLDASKDGWAIQAQVHVSL